MANQWYPFFPGDFARDTSDLSMIEECVYRRLLDFYYSTGGPLPANAERLQRICRAFADAEQQAVQHVMHKFFVMASDGYRNSRADAIIAKSKIVSEKRALAAIKSHAARAKAPANADANAHANEGVLHVPPQPQPHIKPLPLKEEAAASPKVETMIRQEVDTRRDFIRANFHMDDAEINVQVEEMVVKARARPPGPDIWLYISRFLTNRADDLRAKKDRKSVASPRQTGKAPSGGISRLDRNIEAARRAGELLGVIDAEE